jgi:ADP-ribose pyrophosphatase
MSEEVVFATPWFQIVAKDVDGSNGPHYSLRTKDYVSVVAVTEAGRLILVRQYRPAVDRMTLELPSGHVEPGETPEIAARKELLEETGYIADTFTLLGNLSPDTGRLGNRMWCFLAKGARPDGETAFHPEPGIEPILFDGSLTDLLAEPEFDSALNSAALLLSVVYDDLPVRKDRAEP